MTQEEYIQAEIGSMAWAKNEGKYVITQDMLTAIVKASYTHGKVEGFAEARAIISEK